MIGQLQQFLSHLSAVDVDYIFHEGRGRQTLFIHHLIFFNLLSVVTGNILLDDESGTATLDGIDTS